MLIIDKQHLLNNPADRDHCMRNMVALTLLKGAWPEADDYADECRWAKDPEVYKLRSRTTMEEDPQMTARYYDFELRSAASGLTVSLEDGSDGTVFDEVVVEVTLTEKIPPTLSRQNSSD
ncbi:hypothetical protein PUNSTDRAFT_133656 [Punctularia strigosozonata HHB-11173 SS5]|uniref:uncharacterized protein n=1 Tax=Punctularia strigosozonata (strain HHB-11173) TaxID=741275 RepID=UPI000441752A|nr:uncharacterized protein PUNSTDRAFT_133656 [Punctularia strigosozonata HHB-11173 SS5]EIN09885.1 hypothetical protein PUNSTDRAFT_133656 [Punctularia strigosozonata HHB-11173 SS5]